MKLVSLSKFVFLLSVSILFLSFGIQDVPVPGKNEVTVGNTRVRLVERELVVDYELRFGHDVVNCDVDVIVLVDGKPYRLTKYYSGDFGRQSHPGSKQVRLRVSPQKELLSGRDIKFRLDITRKELANGKVIEISPIRTMPEVSTNTNIKRQSNVAEFGGTVVSDGGAPVTKRGIVWSTRPNPTIERDTKIEDKGGIGDFVCKAKFSTIAQYYIRAYATNSVGTSYGNEVIANIDNLIFEDLSANGSANCYLVSEAGAYKFKTVKGNSSTSVGSVASCEVLWESFGTAATPSVGDLIKNASYNDGYIAFETATTFCEGNAVIAAKDASGNILWSWHIWLTDQPKGQTYNNGAGVMMDRNLGATSATPGDVGALGLLYQWGRKDPFLSSSSFTSSTKRKSTITWPSSVSSTSSTGTIAYATSHPTTCIASNNNNHDWYYSSGSTTDNTRWESSKTIYDPCPVGWRVPDGGSSGVWAKAFGKSYSFKRSWDSSNKGMDFSKTDKKLGSSGPIWYPMFGDRMYYLGGSKYFDYYSGKYWSATPSGIGAYFLLVYYDGEVHPAKESGCRDGRLSVRCLQE